MTSDIPLDFDLSSLVGCEVSSITVARHAVYVNWWTDAYRDGAQIRIDGRWELLDGEVVIDRGTGHDDAGERPDPLYLHRIIGRAVTGWSIDGPTAFIVRFDGGLALRVSDDSRGQYEWTHVKLAGDASECWHL